MTFKTNFLIDEPKAGIISYTFQNIELYIDFPSNEFAGFAF